MRRYSLKRRNKALFGADGAIQAAATIAAATMQSAATAKAAKEQATATREQAKTQAQSLQLQNENNNRNQERSTDFIRQQNEETRQQQNNIQATLQLLAGQENMNDRMEKTKVAVKYGGNPKKRPKLRNQSPSYGGTIMPFKVTDGGGVIPLDIDENGYGLYEIYGNDHEHYHKTNGGKYKSGVGFKFADGTIVEGEGNQNTSTGEKLYVTPEHNMFLSKHNIGGFNPSAAVDYGMSPEEAFTIQESIKAIKGYNDNGTKKGKAQYGYDVLTDRSVVNAPYLALDLATGGAAVVGNKTPVKERFHLRYGGCRRKAKDGNYAPGYGGAWNTAIGNVLGAGIGVLGNWLAGKSTTNAYREANKYLVDAYNNLTGIDPTIISREDYAPAHAMAAVRSADTNINPQLERIRKNAVAEGRAVKRNTLSSAARLSRLAGIGDRSSQLYNEAYATKHNQDEQIAQANAATITDVAKFNAQRDQQANNQYTNALLDILQYNNYIENSKILGIGQSRADSVMGIANTKANLLNSSASMIGSAITSSAAGFAKARDNIRDYNSKLNNALIGADTEDRVDALVMLGDKGRAEKLYNSYKALAETPGLNDNTRNTYIEYANRLATTFGFDTVSAKKK